MLRASFTFCALAVALIQGAPSNEDDGWRVVGGTDAKMGAAPYQVILKVFGDFMCSGSIITKKTILTAAHCISGSGEQITITVGTNALSSGGETYEAERVICHENHDPIARLNDVGLIIIKKEIQFSDLVSSIPLGKEEVGGSVPVTLTGWGSTGVDKPVSENLQTIDLKTISHEVCKGKWGPEIARSHLCTLTKAGEGACFGDSGGPLTADNKLVGVVSWGQPCAKGYPDVYSRVSSFVDWIEKNASY